MVGKTSSPIPSRTKKAIKPLRTAFVGVSTGGERWWRGGRPGGLDHCLHAWSRSAFRTRIAGNVFFITMSLPSRQASILFRVVHARHSVSFGDIPFHVQTRGKAILPSTARLFELRASQRDYSVA